MHHSHDFAKGALSSSTHRSTITFLASNFSAASG